MQQKELQVKIGKQIAKLRKQKKLSQVDFAYMLDKDKQNLNRLEKGKTNVTIGTLNQIAKLLDIPIQKLLDWD
ncbi:MAG: helix-turn-helix transcriptional regulator [Bacteroidetes bacterium]|nr:helix-turn-helix transcriptional regulator [Bacteroidota bacterium]